MADQNRTLALRLLITARDRASKVLDGINGKMTALAASVAGLVTGGVIAKFFQTIIGSAADLQEQMAVVQSVTQATVEDLARLEQAAEAMGAATKFNAVEAAQAEEELARAGFSVDQVLSALAPTLNLAAANKLDMATAANILSKSLNGFQLAAGQATRVADVLSETAASSGTNVLELFQAVSYAAPAAVRAGMSIEETAAFIGKLSDSAIGSSRAGTVMVSVLAQIADPASKASKALDKAGISTKSLSSVIAGLSKGGPAAERAILAFGTEAGPGLSALVATGAEAIAELEQRLLGAEGSSKKAANIISDVLNGALTSLGSIWDTVQKKLGQPLLDSAQREVEALTQTLRDWLASDDFQKVQDSLVEAFTVAGAAVRKFVKDFSLSEVSTKIAGFVSNSSKYFGEFLSLLDGLISATKRAFGLFAGLWHSLQVITQGITSLFIKSLAAIVGALNSFGLDLDNAYNTIHRYGDAYWRAAEENAEKAKNGFLDFVGAQTDATNATASASEKAAKSNEAWRLSTEELEGAMAKVNDTLAESAQQRAAADAQQQKSIEQQKDEADQMALLQSHYLQQLKAFQADLEARGQLEAAARVSIRIAEEEARILAAHAAAQDTDTVSLRDKINALIEEVDARQASYNATQRETDLLTRRQQLDIQRLRNRQDALRASGQEAAAARIDIDIAKEKLDQARQLVEAKKAEQKAAEDYAAKLAEQREEEGAVSEIKQEQIDVAKAVVEGKKLEVEAAQAAIDAAKTEIKVTEQTISAKKKSAAASDELTQAEKRAADEAARLKEAFADRAYELDLGKSIDGVEDLGNYAQLAAEQFARLSDEIVYAASRPQLLDRELKQAAAQAVRIAQVARAVDTLTERLQAGAAGATALAHAEQFAARSGEQLGEERLDALRSALADAKRRAEDLANSATDSLETWRQRLAELTGDERTRGLIEQTRELRDLTEQLAAARASGDTQSITRLQQAIGLAREYYTIRAAQSAAPAPAANGAAATPDNVVPINPTARVTERVAVDFLVGGTPVGSLEGSRADVDQILRRLSDLQRSQLK